jgi:membrane fusion protein, copper/silver efflux system
LRMGQLAVATFKKHSKEFLWIPVSARMDLGNQQIVFVKQRNIFQARKIITARESQGWIEVLGGLELTDSIAYRAQFMVDSEGFVKVGN